VAQESYSIFNAPKSAIVWKETRGEEQQKVLEENENILLQ